MVGGRPVNDAAVVLPSAASSRRAYRSGASPLTGGFGYRPAVRGGLTQTLLAIAIAAATILLLLTSTNALGATLVTPRCDNVNLRTSPTTTATRKTQVDTGARLTVVGKVTGGSYSAICGGAQSGHDWYKV